MPLPVWATREMLFSGCAAICRSISARVSSVEPPSTKISSVPLPISGSRSTAAAMFPASFRHGQTTETLSSSPGSANGRATIQYVRQRWLKGQMLATKPLRKVESSGTRLGRRMRRVRVTGSKRASSRTLRMSSGETQLRSGLRAFRRRSSARPMIGRQSWLWKLTMTLVRACEWRRRFSKSPTRSCAKGTRSERTM